MTSLMVNLLTHTSGLDDFPILSENSIQSAVSGAATQKLKGTSVEPVQICRY